MAARQKVMKNEKKKIESLSTEELMAHPCSECGGQIKRKAISQEFEREGVKIKISGFMAWACSRCGEVYFEPGGADRLVQAANALFALSIGREQHKGKVLAKVA